MDPDIVALQQQHSALHTAVHALQNKWHITVTVAAVLGALGIVLATFLFNAMTELEKTKRELVAGTRDLELAKTQAGKDISEQREQAMKQVSAAVYAALEASKAPMIGAWLAEERKQREEKDVLQSKWIRYIYAQANANGQTNPYANGWWQDSLKKSQQAVDLELP
ncbi:hypothetical protein YQ44_10780 [Janthinobacterium sp. 1_2014MBL_MicDiv]|nr:hypothetical protein YQ44_10780 [Janthinobacterium sp. 1_2014MBL_MicDiv]